MNLIDISESKDLKLIESKIPGTLGTITGTFFLPEAISRNKRKYSKKAWENALGRDDAKRFLTERLMCGTLGHADMSLDDLAREGKLSHVTTKLFIDKDGRGIGEAEILDTPAGNVLNALYRAKCGLAISSKAYGEYIGQDENGVNEVDENSFTLERFDFVFDPGFLDARPQLKEMYESIANNKNKKDSNEEGFTMEIVEKLTKENAKLEEMVAKLTEEVNNKKTANQVETLTKENETLKAENKKLVSYAETLIAIKQQLGTPEAIKKSLEKAIKLQDSLKELGTPEKIKEALVRANKLAEELKPFGTVKDIKDALTRTSKMLEGLKTIGTAKDIKEALTRSKKFIEATKARIIKQQTTELATKTGVAEAKIAGYLKKGMTLKEVKELISDFKGVEEVKNFVKPTKKTDENKGKEQLSIFDNGKSRVDRMFESYKR